MIDVMLVGQVPFGASCRTCGKFNSTAGFYWQDKRPTKEQMAEFIAAYECKECARLRKIVREELAVAPSPEEG